MPGDDDLGADETSLRLECPPGYAFSHSASPALDASLVKRHIVLRRGLGWVVSYRDEHRHGRARAAIIGC